MKKIFLTLFFTVLFLLLFFTIWLDLFFQSLTIEQIVFFLNTSLKGTDSSFYFELCLYIFLPSLILTWIVFYVYQRFQRLRFYILLFSAFFYCIFFIALNNRLKISDYVSSSSKKGSFYELYYINPKKVKIDNKLSNKQNLIIIFLESMEKNFSNVENGLNLIPYLDGLSKNNISFSDFTEGYTQNWTQGAFFSAMTGIPINYVADSGDEDNQKGMLIKSFAPNIYSLPQVLQNFGYTNFFIQGSDISFSGTDTFLFSHGFEEENVYDLSRITNEYKDIKPLPSWWGLKDEDTFKVFKDKLSDISKKSPFFAIMFTIDAHRGDFPYLYEKPFLNEAQNVIYNTSLLMNDFVEWFNKQDFADKTTLVIIGDHLRMSDDNSSFLLENGNSNRRIYNVFINAKSKVENRNRSFNQTDMFPTLLEAIGMKINAGGLGLGRSVFSHFPTLVEQLGNEELKEKLMEKNTLYNDLWK